MSLLYSFLYAQLTSHVPYVVGGKTDVVVVVYGDERYLRDVTLESEKEWAVILDAESYSLRKIGSDEKTDENALWDLLLSNYSSKLELVRKDVNGKRYNIVLQDQKTKKILFDTDHWELIPRD